MGLFNGKKHVPPEPRDPRPKGADWKDPGHVKMTAYLAKKENRRIERETYERLAKKGKA